MLTPRLVSHVKPQQVIAAGFLIAALGFGLLTQVGSTRDVALVVTAYAVFSLGLAPVFTLASDLIVSAAPPERAGAAAGISEMSTELGGALGIALLGSILTFFYRGGVAGTLGGELPPQALDAVRDTLGGALAAAAALPEPSSTALVIMARRAFVATFRATALTSAVIALLAASASWSSLDRKSVPASPRQIRLNREDPAAYDCALKARASVDFAASPSTTGRG